MKRYLIMAALLLIALVIGTNAGVSAQTGGKYDLTWNTVSSGSYASTGGAFTMMATIGQPDASRMSGAAYALNGGFWVDVFGYRFYMPLIMK